MQTNGWTQDVEAVVFGFLFCFLKVVFESAFFGEGGGGAGTGCGITHDRENFKKN